MRKRITLMLALMLVTLVAGCGGSDGEASAKAPSTFFGLISSRPMEAADYQRLGRKKIRVFRFLISWPGVQASQGAPYDWTATDDTFARLARNNVRPLPYLMGSPKWIAPTVTHPPVRSQAGRKGWKSFARAAVRRYGPRGAFWDRFALTDPGIRPKPARTWEIWNEQNIPAFWRPKPKVSEYARLLKMSSRVIRGVDKRAQIMTGGPFGAPGAEGSIFSWRYLSKLAKKKRIKRHIDVVGMHPYSQGLKGVKKQVRKVRGAMVRNGLGRRPMVIDEIGWGSDPNADSLVAKSPQGQARALKRSFNLFLNKRKKWKLRHVIWYQYRDPDPGKGQPHCPFCDSAGLLTASGSAKPAWHQFLKFIR